MRIADDSTERSQHKRLSTVEQREPGVVAVHQVLKVDVADGIDRLIRKRGGPVRTLDQLRRRFRDEAIQIRLIACWCSVGPIMAVDIQYGVHPITEPDLLSKLTK